MKELSNDDDFCDYLDNDDNDDDYYYYYQNVP